MAIGVAFQFLYCLKSLSAAEIVPRSTSTDGGSAKFRYAAPLLVPVIFFVPGFQVDSKQGES